jgi:broad specificity phosphatase PhoE
MRTIFIVIVLLAIQIVDMKLYQSFVFFRHGARYHNNDVYDGNSTYPVRSELTSIGMRMLENLGKLVRKQYISANPLLSDKYNSS